LNFLQTLAAKYRTQIRAKCDFFIRSDYTTGLLTQGFKKQRGCEFIASSLCYVVVSERTPPCVCARRKWLIEPYFVLSGVVPLVVLLLLPVPLLLLGLLPASLLGFLPSRRSRSS
jgi:hypothetical protein